MAEREATDRRRWTLVVLVYAALVGATVQARGALVPEFAAAFPVSEGLLGLVTPAYTLGFMSVLLVVGLALSRLPVTRVYVGGIVLTGVALALVSAAWSFSVLLGLLVVRGAATGAFRGVGRPVLSHLYPAARGRMTNLQTMAWAVGATAGPLFVTAVLFVGNWQLVYLLMGVAFFPALLLLYRTGPPPGIENERGLSLAGLRGLAGERVVRGMAAALVVSGGIESVVFSWLPFYGSQFLGQAQANLLLSVFLLAYVPGRLVYSRLADRADYLDVLLVAALLDAVVLGATLAFARGVWLFAGVFLVGLLVAGLFPLTIAWGLDAVPEHSGPVNAVGMFAAQIGFLVFPGVVGVLAEWTDITAAMHVLTALTVVYAVVIAANRALAGQSART